MKKLIVNADDFGLTPGINRAVKQGVIEGIITDTTLMVNMPAAREAMDIAMECFPDRVGIHLNLTCGRPVLDPAEVPSLVDKSGRFYRRRAALMERATLRDIEKELRAQVDKFLRSGLKPSHLDCHHHLHLHPMVAEIVAELALELNVPVRAVDSQTRAFFKSRGVITPDQFSVDFYGEGASYQNLVSILDSYSYGVMEIMTHPGYCDQELLEISTYTHFREKELEILTNPFLRGVLEEKDIVLVSFNDLKTEKGSL
ncbi:chitin disaccharide deacetylase [Thermosediminibacter oceani]|uniref:YdjC family protein n=1 Tax=Thermosediminibacter oceani (strain ATCC BAA-1034 / DSM 16646 / JW/IW-1228P) TaxID=555079 RepID=D9S0V8_THEOJ|nr:chitin disaccharide deacetylase [Thermosediminibacter oceani]ADL07122.1 YdjC family protein [Thermosediminibacter oceani DSM 16646]